LPADVDGTQSNRRGSAASLRLNDEMVGRQLRRLCHELGSVFGTGNDVNPLGVKE
jgi:hypothetical protein